MIVKVQRQTSLPGQKYTNFSVDQQFFAVTVNVIWLDPENWKLFISLLERLHLLISFISCISKLMEGTDLKETLKGAFAMVEKLLTGKKF